MKIAYLFHGHSRTWKDCYQSFFDNVFSVAPGDIYIYTWDTVNATTGSWWTGDWNSLSSEALEISQRRIDINGIWEAFNPKVFIVQKNKEVSSEEFCPGTALTKAHLGVNFMLESSRAVFQSACTQDNYDRFVCTRLDVLFKTKLNPEELNSEHMVVEDYYPGTRFRDIVLMGNKDQLEIKTNFRNHIQEYFYNPLIKNIQIDYETALFKYCSDHNLSFQNSSLKFSTPRCF